MAEADKWALENDVELDMSLDDIEDLPGFATFPTGAYLCILHEGILAKMIGAEGKEQKPIFEIPLKLKEIVEPISVDNLDAEQDDGTQEQPPKPGDICTIGFMRNNKVAVAAFKKFCGPLSARLGTKNIGQIASGCKDMTVTVVLKRTYDLGKDRHYVKVKRIAVP